MPRANSPLLWIFVVHEQWRRVGCLKAEPVRSQNIRVTLSCSSFLRLSVVNHTPLHSTQSNHSLILFEGSRLPFLFRLRVFVERFAGVVLKRIVLGFHIVFELCLGSVRHFRSFWLHLGDRLETLGRVWAPSRAPCELLCVSGQNGKRRKDTALDHSLDRTDASLHHFDARK